MMKKKAKLFLCVVLFAVSLPFLRLGVIYGAVVVELWLHTEYPILFYKGDKTVPQEDMVKIGDIYMRDLRTKVYLYNENYGQKYYLLKKNRLPLSDLRTLLSDYCRDFFDAQDEYDKMLFDFFEECPKMPWYWNDSSVFPDLEELEYNGYENRIMQFVVNEGHIRWTIWKHGKLIMKGCSDR